jgi:uncharacterized membrane protein/thiol-disulfide isomerase/thioredoxin
MLKRLLLPVFLLVFFAAAGNAAAQTASSSSGTATVQAILFYSPTCPHCHQVINELLLPMQDEYGEQLQIIGIDTSNETGQVLYGTAVEHFAIPDNRIGVPTLIVRDTVLVGAQEIPDQFPGIVEEGLASGGIGWPDIPNLALIIPDLPPSAGSLQTEAAVATSSTDETSSADETSSTDEVTGSLDEASRELDEAGAGSGESAVQDPPSDPVGFTLAWVVLIGMIVALVYALRRFFAFWQQGGSRTAPPESHRLVPLLALLGLGVASYLAYVEVTHVTAVCGPIGECNIVQSSPYASLFGIPVAVLGVLSYLSIIALWFGQRYLPASTASWSFLGLILLTVIGTLFSIYLTALEIFAIEAICMWCLSSAVITSLIMVLVTSGIGGKSPQAKLAAQTKI